MEMINSGKGDGLTADERHQVGIVLTRHHHRMMAAGIPFNDWDALRQRDPSTWRGWYDHWVRTGAAYDARGTAALDGGHRITAASHWTTGSLCYHFAQFMLYRLPPEKQQAADARSRLYAKAVPLLRPYAERIDVATGNLQVPVILRTPSDSQGRVPCVMIVPGLEATKEEMHNWESFYLDRGMATATFDGPGQGELSHVRLDPPVYVAAVRALVDVLQKDERISANAIGIMGVSLGGMLASMVAAQEPRLAAAAEVCGSFDTMSRWDRANALSKAGHRHVTHSESDEETLERIRSWSMSGLAERIRCPFLIVHGEKDPIVPLDQAQMYHRNVSHAELVVMEGANHVCNNIPNVARPFISDWFVGRLASP